MKATAIVAMAGMVFLATVVSAVDNNSWQYAEGSFDGNVTNAAHWGKGHVPTLGERFFFNTDLTRNFTVTFPECVYTNQAAFRMMGATGYTKTVIGTDCTWVMPGSEDGSAVYDGNPFRIFSGGEAMVDFQTANAGDYSHAVAEISDFTFVLNAATDNAFLTFDGGTYDFLMPAGSEWTTAAKPVLALCGGAATEQNSIEFTNGASLRAPSIDFVGGAPANVLTFDGGSHLFGSVSLRNKNGGEVSVGNGAAFTCDSFALGTGLGGTLEATVSGAGTEFRCNGELTTTRGSGLVTFGVADGATAVVKGNVSVYGGKIRVSGGKFSTETTSYLRLGRDVATSPGELEVSAGAVTVGTLFTGVNGGYGSIDISGGTLAVLSSFRLGCTENSTKENTLFVTGGEVICDIAALSVAHASGSHASVSLSGGVISCQTLVGGSGEASLTANGGTLKALKSSVTLLSSFDTAMVDAGGLTIDTNGKSVTLDQNLTGSGLLTLTGGGTVTFAAGMSVAGPVRVLGDTRLILNGQVLNGLTLGAVDSAAIMTIPAGSTIAVNGELDLVKLNLTVTGTSVGQSYDLIAATDVSSETSARWTRMGISGLPAGAGCDQIVVDGAPKTLRIAVRTAKTECVTVDEGERKTDTQDYALKSGDTLNVTAGAGGSIRMEGYLGRGNLVKDGLGDLVLTNPESEFSGIDFILGTLSFDLDGTPSPLWTLYPSGAEKTTELKLNAVRDVTLAGLEENGTGTLIKSGAGRLVFQAADTVRRGIDSPIICAEGELVLRGCATTDGTLSYVSLRGGTTVGCADKASGMVSSAGLVFDRMSAADNGVIADSLNDPAAVMNEVYLVISNGSQVVGMRDFIPETCRQNTQLKAWALVDDAVWSLGSEPIVLNTLCPTVHAPKIFVRNNAELRGSLKFRAVCDIEVDHAMIGPDNDGKGQEYEMSISYMASYDYTNNLTFANGSVLNSQVIRCATTAAYATPAHFNFIFDNSEWKGMRNDFWGYVDPQTANNPYVVVKMR